MIRSMLISLADGAAVNSYTYFRPAIDDLAQAWISGSWLGECRNSKSEYSSIFIDKCNCTFCRKESDLYKIQLQFPFETNLNWLSYLNHKLQIIIQQQCVAKCFNLSIICHYILHLDGAINWNITYRWPFYMKY